MTDEGVAGSFAPDGDGFEVLPIEGFGFWRFTSSTDPSWGRAVQGVLGIFDDALRRTPRLVSR